MRVRGLCCLAVPSIDIMRTWSRYQSKAHIQFTIGGSMHSATRGCWGKRTARMRSPLIFGPVRVAEERIAVHVRSWGAKRKTFAHIALFRFWAALLGHQRPPEFLRSGRDVFKVTRSGRHNYQHSNPWVGMPSAERQRE